MPRKIRPIRPITAQVRSGTWSIYRSISRSG
jgi:hypothetical protein